MAVLAPCLPLRAEVVRLEVGRDLYGQGWMFLDTDGACKVVTAAHVVRDINGRLRNVLALDRNGHEWPAGVPIVVSLDPDIAVLPLPAANSPAACGEGRLSDIGVARRVSQMSDAVIATTDQASIITIPVTRRATAIDDAGGGLFAVRPTLAADQIKKGWSGSVVQDAEGPLGIVFEVDALHNEALAVRIDVVRHLMEHATAHDDLATSLPLSAAPLIAGVLGATLDPEEGPQKSLAGSGGSWVVQPADHAAALTATFRAPVQLHEITIRNDATGNQIVGVDVATQADTGEQDWTDANYCRFQPGATIRCPFLIRTIMRLRLTIKTRGDTSIHVADLTFR